LNLAAFGGTFSTGLTRLTVRGHDVKKDISMLMRLTKDNYVAFNKGQGEFSKS
jgi:hypothetical protein